MTKRLKLAALFMTRDSTWETPIHTLGWWIALCPPLGWLMALGYRKEVVLHFKRAHAGPLPTWGGSYFVLYLLREGVKALGVISVYLLPTLATTWTLGSADGWSDLFGGITYCLCSLVLVPVTLPMTPLLYSIYSESFMLSYPEAAIVFALSTLTTFIIPAGFMRVARRGLMRDALHLPQALRTVYVYWRPYLLAWRDSLHLSLAGLCDIFWAPWGIAWSYLGIVLCFNDILASAPHRRDSAPYSEGWMTLERAHYEREIELLLSASTGVTQTESLQTKSLQTESLQTESLQTESLQTESLHAQVVYRLGVPVPLFSSQITSMI